MTVKAAEELAAKGRKVRVVSMPSTTVFDRQDAAYRESVLPLSVLARVAVETSHVDYWSKYVGLDGRVVGMTTFGESAPGPALLEHFGFTVENNVNTVEELLQD
jgi:transketolase